MTTPHTGAHQADLTDGRNLLYLEPDSVDQIAGSEDAAASAPPREADREPVYEDVVAWVEQMMLPHYRRPLTSDTRWCPYWWEHTEAVARLEACWRAWEHLRYEGPTAIAAWFRDYFDPMIGQLTSRDGPFHACRTDSRGGHQVPPLWASVPAPAGLLREMSHSNT